MDEVSRGRPLVAPTINILMRTSLIRVGFFTALLYHGQSRRGFFLCLPGSAFFSTISHGFGRQNFQKYIDKVGKMCYTIME